MSAAPTGPAHRQSPLRVGNHPSINSTGSSSSGNTTTPSSSKAPEESTNPGAHLVPGFQPLNLSDISQVNGGQWNSTTTKGGATSTGNPPPPYDAQPPSYEASTTSHMKGGATSTGNPPPPYEAQPPSYAASTEKSLGTKLKEAYTDPPGLKRFSLQNLKTGLKSHVFVFHRSITQLGLAFSDALLISGKALAKGGVSLLPTAGKLITSKSLLQPLPAICGFLLGTIAIGGACIGGITFGYGAFAKTVMGAMDNALKYSAKAVASVAQWVGSKIAL